MKGYFNDVIKFDTSFCSDYKKDNYMYVKEDFLKEISVQKLFDFTVIIMFEYLYSYMQI